MASFLKDASAASRVKLGYEKASEAGPVILGTILSSTQCQVLLVAREPLCSVPMEEEKKHLSPFSLLLTHVLI